MKYCGQCGQELAEEARFCNKCGAVSSTATSVDTTGATPVEGAVEAAVETPLTSTVEPTVEKPIEPVETRAEAPVEPLVEPEVADLSTQTTMEMAAGNQAGEGFAGMVPTEPVLIPPAPARKRWPMVLAGVLVLLLICGGALGAVYYMGNFGGPKTLKLAPVDSALYVCFKPNLLQSRNFKHLQEVYMAAPETSQAIEKFMGEWKRETNTDFEQEIKSWAGKEAAFIMPDINEEHFIFAMETSNDAKAKEFIAKIDDGQSNEENYHGVALKYNQMDGSAYAVADGFLLLSNDVDLLKSTIDRQLTTPASSLADNTAYQKLESSLPWNRSLLYYYDFKQFAGLLEQQSGELGPIADMFESMQAAACSVSVEKDGIRADSAVAFTDENSIPEYYRGRDGEKEELKAAMQMIPANAFGFVRSSNVLNFAIDLYREILKQNDPLIAEGIDEFEQETGISLENDVLNPLRGDITIALTPKNGNTFGEEDIPIGGLVLLGVKDQAKISSLIDNVSNQASAAGVYVDRKQVSGGSTYCFGPSYGNQAFGVALKNDMVLVASSGELTNAIMEQQGGTIENNRLYQESFENLPGNWNREFYLDIQAVMDLADDSIPEYDRAEYDQYVRPLLYPVKSLSQARSTDTDQGIIQGAMFIKIE